MASLDAVANKLATLAAPDPESRRQELLTYLRGRPEFEASGINEDGSLWARFTDERLLLFPIAMVVEPPAGTAMIATGPVAAARIGDRSHQAAITVSEQLASAAGPPAELPASVQARFLSGGDPPGTHTIMPVLQGLVTSRGYRLAANAGIGTIEDLLRVGGDGVFYFAGHGGPGHTRNGTAYAVTTATRISAAGELQYMALWQDGSLAYGFPITSLLRPYSSTVPPNTWPSGQRPEDYYGFTAKFVELHMGDFAESSLVYIAACTSFDPGFRDAFLAKKAGVYFGWTNLVGPLADADASLYLFDRLLGTNDPFVATPEVPDQRPFDYLSVYNDMASEHLLTYAGTKGTAKLEKKAGLPEFGLLAPSIQHMRVDEEQGLLILTGKFGTDPGEVKINGQDLHVDAWGNEEIKAIIDVDGPKSAGDVVVWSKGRKSNTRRLTDWRPTFRLEFVPGGNTLKWEGELRLHFRADVASYREEAGHNPKYRMVPFQIAADSYGELEASGDDGDPNSPTKWEGVASISNRIALGSPNLMDVFGEFDTQFPALRMWIAVLAQQGMESVEVKGGQRTPLFAVWVYPGDGSTLSAPLPNVPAMSVSLDHRFGILGALKRMHTAEALFWSNYSPQYAPLDDLARSPFAFSRLAVPERGR